MIFQPYLMHFLVDLMTFSVIKLLKNNHHKKDNKKTNNNNSNNNSFEKCCKHIYVNSLPLFTLTPSSKTKNWLKIQLCEKKRKKYSLHTATTYLFTWHRQNRVDIMTMELGKEKKIPNKTLNNDVCKRTHRLTV